jgi:hypothetical protein
MSRTHQEVEGMNTAIAGEKRTLTTLVEGLAELDANFRQISLDPKELKFDADGIRYRNQFLGLNEDDRSQLYRRIEAPAAYLGSLSPALQAWALSEHSARGDFGSRPTLILAKDRLLTIARGEFEVLEYATAFEAVAQAMEGHELTVSRIGMTQSRLEVDLVNADRTIAVRPGDIVQCGLHVVHDRFGNQATRVEAYFLRLECSNGLTSRHCAGDHAMRTRKLPVGFEHGRELQMEQIRRLTRENWSNMQDRMTAIRATSERKADAQALLKNCLLRSRVSWNTMESRLLSAWRREGEEDSVWGVVNTLTRVATHDTDLSERQRRVLASLAGLLTFARCNLCDRCFSVLARGA